MRLRLLTFNVWALPWPVARDTSTRLSAIGAQLPILDADVVALQEVWTPAARDVLVEAGRRSGYRQIWHKSAPTDSGGLLILSRLPIREAHFTTFRMNGLPQRVQHAEYYSGKGFVILSVEAPDGVFSLATTHLHARYARSKDTYEYTGHRAAQIVEFAAALAKVQQPIVALGDFNLRERSPEYRCLMGLTGLRDLARELDRRQDTILRDNPYRHRDQKRGGRIDYIFVRDGAARAVRPLHLRRVFDDYLQIDGQPGAYSDHAGLLAEVEIAGPGKPLSDPSPLALDLAQALLRVGREKAQLRRGEHRLWAGTGAAASLATLALARRVTVTRRKLLRDLLFGVPAAAMLSCAGIATLAERFIPAELRGYDEIDRLLRELRPRR